MDSFIDYNINPLVSHLQKHPSEFTRKDIIRYIVDKGIRMVNFRYVAADGRLKTLNFTVSSIQYLNTILTYGERVDGSSLFPFIEAGSSDLYVIPRFSTAYSDPFAQIPTLGMLCSYFTKEGLPLESAPEYTLKKAAQAFYNKTGLTFEAMGELEFYVSKADENLYPAQDQRGYHESAPFTKFENFRSEAMNLIASCGGEIKYGHSEVGNFSQDGVNYEQNEIEFLATRVERAADQLVLAKWIIRTLAYKYGLNVTFAPKITVGKAGSGLHFHTRMTKNGASVMTSGNGLSAEAIKAIAGYIHCASSLTAFGNTNPTSYFRLVPKQEAPTNICWGDRNRSVLVRVPLGWLGERDMLHSANPNEPGATSKSTEKQTVELRSPDGSADIYHIMAGLAVAARIGFEMENPEEVAKNSYVDINIHDYKNQERASTLKQLPSSCWESANELERMRDVYEKEGVFHPSLIDGIITKLKSYNDKDIREQIKREPEIMTELVNRFYHCG